MTKVINLRQVRKAAARAEKRRSGDAAAALSGRSRTERDLQQAAEAKARRDLDGHQRERE